MTGMQTKRFTGKRGVQTTWGMHLPFALIVASLVAGCAAGPDFHRPSAPQADSYAPGPLPHDTAAAPTRLGEAQHFDPRQEIPYDWWKLFRSPHINSLIEKAFKANPTIESAQAALREAQQNVIAQQGFFFPSVGVSYMPSRNKLAGNMGGNSPGVQGNGTVIQTYSNPGGPAPFNGPVYYNFHTAQVNLSYVPDVFGGNRRAVESLEAQTEIQRFQLEAAYITLASNVVAAALQEASLRAQIAAMDKMVENNRQLVQIVSNQVKLGYAMGLDLAAQESALAQSEQALIPLRQQLEQTRDLIRMLSGHLPNDDVPETFELDALQLPERLPLSLPSRLVEQRPDVRAAEEQIRSANAQVGVALANRFPQFSITGAIGGEASTFNQMTHAGAGFFNLIGEISLAVFDGGTLSAREQAAREGLAQATAQYKIVVLSAFQNVADTLHAVQSDADALNAAFTAERAANKTLGITRKQYELGQVAYPALLAADQAYRQATLSLIQARTNRLGDTAALYQSLGGGWWNRPADTSTADRNP
jgi:NodT family efflux transporter outer membrane factor (OMF) lipoprotein